MSWNWPSRRTSAALLPHRGISHAALPLSDAEAVDHPSIKGNRRRRRWRRWFTSARSSYSTLLVFCVLCLSVVLTVAAALSLWSVPTTTKADVDKRVPPPAAAPSDLLPQPTIPTRSPQPDALSLLLCPATLDSHVLPRGADWLCSYRSQHCGSVDSQGSASLCDDPSSASSPFTLRRGTGYGLPSRTHQQPAAERRWDSYSEDDAAVQERVQWMSEYEFHNLTQRAAHLPARYQPTTAPWYELHLSPTGLGSGWRLLVHEAQWRLSSAAAVDGVNLLVSVIPVAAHWDVVGSHTLNLSYTNVALAEAILDRMHCSFTVDDRGGGVEDVQSAMKLIDDASPVPVLFTANPLIHSISHHIIHCPLPRLPSHVHSLLTRSSSSGAGPRLFLSSLTLHLDQSRAPTFGVSLLTLPLCLLRQRRVTVAVVLSTQLGPPHLLSLQRMHSFLSYYMFLGVELFIVPERFGMLLDALLPYIAMGVVWYVRQPFLSAHHQPYMDQIPVLHSCVLRLHYVAEWVISVDVDEYIALDHPYWTEGAGVQPPSDDCWLLSSDTTLGDRGSAGCRSILSAFVSQPGFERLSLLSLANVPHWGLAPAVNESLLALSSAPSAATAYLNTLHTLDVWNRRCYGAEYHRFKLLFRPAHVLTVNMHEAKLLPDCCVRGVGGGVVDAWHKYWGDAGLQQHKDTILQHALTERAGVDQATLLQQLIEAAQMQQGPDSNTPLQVQLPELTVEHEAVHWHPALHLVQLLCTDEMRLRSDVQLSFDLRCCDVASVSNACFVQGATSFSPYLLATLTPLFPTVAQSNLYSPTHPSLPNPIPKWAYPLPLALFGLHVSHFICSHLAAVDLSQCTAANRTWPMGAMWGESQRAGVSFHAEASEERSKVLLRAQLKQWMAQRPLSTLSRVARRVEETSSVGNGDL